MMTLKSLKMYIQHPTQLLVRLGKNSFLKKMNDEQYLKMLYRDKFGYTPDFNNPNTFNEKLQWLKLHDRRPLYTELVDKYEVRKHIAKAIGQEYLIDMVGGPWYSPDEIDFENLPDQFVLKCTHDSGGLVICRDKSTLDREKVKEKIQHSLKQNYYWSSREWSYKDVKPRIIAERYMEDENEAQGLTDYKFFCFNGEPKMIYVSQGLEDHATASISFYDMQGKPMPFRRSDFKPITGEIKLPTNFDEMTRTAKKLAQMVASPFVRIDLYSIHGKTYFSEVTFSPCSGMIPFEPKDWDQKLGQWIQLS